MWHLFSGEELELWLLKTILGFFHANVLSQHGRKIAEVQKIMNRTIEKAYSTGHLPEPCGMYVQQNATTLVQRGVLDFMSLSDERGERVVGCGLTIVGIATTFIMDPGMSNREHFTIDHSYRPDYLFVERGRRRHSIVLTWPPRRSRRAVVYFRAPTFSRARSPAARPTSGTRTTSTCSPDGAVVGRIIKAAAAPIGAPWL
jgi:hypothetical protein